MVARLELTTILCLFCFISGCGRVPTIHEAARLGDVAGVEHQMFDGDAHVSVNARDVDGNTPLHIAAQYGRLEVAKCLLDNEADIHARNTQGGTPLELADKTNHKAVAHLILCHLLCEAAERNDQKTMLRLLKSGLSANCCAATGLRPIHYAAKSGSPKAIAILADYGADVNACSEPQFGYDASVEGTWSDGHTALREALPHIQALDELVRRGARVNEPCGYYGTVLGFAAHYCPACAPTGSIKYLLAHRS